MHLLWIMSVLLWKSLKHADVDVCSEAGIGNVSIARLIPTSSDESKQCFCDIKVHKSTNFGFSYNGPDINACGLQINIENNQFSYYTASLILTLNESTRMTYTYVVPYDWCMVLRTDLPEDKDARFSIICNSDIVTHMSFLHSSTSDEVSESTALRLETDNTRNSPASSTTMITIHINDVSKSTTYRLETDYTRNSPSSTNTMITTTKTTTTSVNINGTCSSESGKTLQDMKLEGDGLHPCSAVSEKNHTQTSGYPHQIMTICKAGRTLTFWSRTRLTHI